MNSRQTFLRTGLAAGLMILLGGCAALPGRDAPRVHVAGIDPLPSEGLELRFAVTLRVQNPNETAIEVDGIALDLDLNGKALASGVSDQTGRVPRFGEAVFTVPVSVSAFAVVRQALTLANGNLPDKVPYALRGKLAGGLFGTLRFTDEGMLSLPQALR